MIPKIRVRFPHIDDPALQKLINYCLKRCDFLNRDSLRQRNQGRCYSVFCPGYLFFTDFSVKKMEERVFAVMVEFMDDFTRLLRRFRTDEHHNFSPCQRVVAYVEGETTGSVFSLCKKSLYVPGFTQENKTAMVEVTVFYLVSRDQFASLLLKCCHERKVWLKGGSPGENHGFLFCSKKTDPGRGEFFTGERAHQVILRVKV